MIITTEPGPSPIFSRPDKVQSTAADSRLHVCSVVFNPQRFRTRWKLYERFAKWITSSGAQLYTVEAAFGNRGFVVTDPQNPHHVQVRIRDEMFVKENLLNLGFQRMPETAKYLAWVDADISAARPDWADEIVQTLQHHAVVQPWTHAFDLGPNHEPIESHNSFAWQWAQVRHIKPAKYGGKWHPGLAFAFRREVLEELGGLLDVCITGGGDWLMAWAMLGEVEQHTWKDWSPGFRSALAEFQKRALRVIKKDIGYVDGTIFHHWHGPKKARQYDTRERILVDYQFDPAKDLLRHVDGGLGLVDDGSERIRLMKEALRRLGKARNEDSTDNPGDEAQAFTIASSN